MVNMPFLHRRNNVIILWLSLSNFYCQSLVPRGMQTNTCFFVVSFQWVLSSYFQPSWYYHICTLDKSLNGEHLECWLLYFKEQTPGSFIYSIFPFMAFHWHTQVGGALRGCIYPEIFFLYSPTHYYFSGTWETGNMHTIWKLKLLETCELICTLKVKHVFWSYSVWVKAFLEVGSICLTNFISYFLNVLLVYPCWN